MRRRSTIVTLSLACLGLIAVGSSTSSAAPPLPVAPAGFFGIAPQLAMTQRDAEYMAAGGITSVRLPVIWSSIQPTRRGGYNWAGLDEGVAIAARAGIRVLPFFYGTPRWLAPKPTTLPIDTAARRQAWTEFLRAAVKRYGPRGEFWREHAKLGPGPQYEVGPGPQYEVGPGPQRESPLPKLPIRSWQIWNEANFFYFSLPVSPTRYAKLVKISSETIKSVDPGAKVILTGLFAKPTASGVRGMPASKFLEILFRVPGIKSRFDGIALHPYAVDTETLEEYVEAFHQVTVENHDRVPLYITEMGWGSQNDFNKVAFEQGIEGQVRELRDAYTYLIENSRRLDLKQVYWFSWKDNAQIPDCNFCDSVGLFREGKSFRPKPAWRAFVAFSGGSLRP